MEIDGIPIPQDYKSPLQQRGEGEGSASQHPLPTRQENVYTNLIVSDFVDYVHAKPTTTDDAYIYGRFIWKSDHVVGDNLRLARIHLTDLFAPETPSTLKAKYEDKYASQPYAVNKDLMTGTIWVSDDTTPDLPVQGQKVKVLHFTKPRVYRDECCQFTTRYQDLWFEQHVTTEQVTTEATSDDDKTKNVTKSVANVASATNVHDTNDKNVTPFDSEDGNPNVEPTSASFVVYPSIAPTEITPATSMIESKAEPRVKLEPDPKKRKLQ
ncbi:hypothetical protein L914_06689 [Phytophthora nicotianae]|uniref:Uncharacterized protein n=1 Tax=Phytophthora nicotianae TaxID=4792 RepID=W2NMD8_PHYNI|nr:hypothetical protein L914_06689 [Phytophthora nicotianae]